MTRFVYAFHVNAVIAARHLELNIQIPPELKAKPRTPSMCKFEFSDPDGISWRCNNDRLTDPTTDQLLPMCGYDPMLALHYFNIHASPCFDPKHLCTWRDPEYCFAQVALRRVCWSSQQIPSPENRNSKCGWTLYRPPFWKWVFWIVGTTFSCRNVTTWCVVSHKCSFQHHFSFKFTLYQNTTTNQKNWPRAFRECAWSTWLRTCVS